MTGLLEPGAERIAGLADDRALVDALLEVEVAWMRVLVSAGAAKVDQADAVEAAAGRWRPDVAELARLTEQSGNPVVPLVAGLRDAVADPDAAALVHRGLTSQDVLDTALMLLARAALDRLVGDLDPTAAALAALAERHRGSVMAGRTLTQHAVPVTFGLVAAQWLVGVLDAAQRVRDVRAQLPVQCGGAAGTLSLAADLVPDAVAAPRELAGLLGLAAPDLPWHTRRSPVTRTGDAVVAVTDVLGTVASQTALLARPEIGELSEGAAEGRGGSSTMPQKQNPVLSVLLRSASLQAPLLAAQLHLAAGQAVDQRPDGAWHSEWPAFRRLLELGTIAAAQARDLVTDLEVHEGVMRDRAGAAAADLLAERYGTPGAVPQDADPSTYLGATDHFIDAALARYRTTAPDDGGARRR